MPISRLILPIPRFDGEISQATIFQLTERMVDMKLFVDKAT
jgi:hypothetical protein